MPAKQIKGTGGLPSGKVFTDDEARKEREKSARIAAAAKMAMDYGVGDFISDIAAPAGAAIGAYAGGPEGAKAGYEAGKEIGSFVGDQEEKEAQYQEMIGNKPQKKKDADPFASALALYSKFASKESK